jgi:transposase
MDILREYLPMILEYNSIFMHNNSLIHKAHKIRDMFIELGIDIIDWPLYSPDLNPIENL